MSMIVAAVITLLLFFYMRFSKHGYELSVVGESRNTARYIGISVPKVIVRTLVLSGAICAVAGFLLAGGIMHTVGSGTVGGQGFTAVLVSWLAQFNPIAMIVVSFVVIFISKGTTRVMENCGIANSFFSQVLTGTLFFIIIACEFFIRYRVLPRKRHKAVAPREDLDDDSVEVVEDFAEPDIVIEEPLSEADDDKQETRDEDVEHSQEETVC